MPHVKHPNPWDLHWKEEPPKCLALKTKGTYIQETQRAIGNRDFTPEGLTHRVIHPGTQHKSSSLKST